MKLIIFTFTLLIQSGQLASGENRTEIYRDTNVVAEIERKPVYLGNLHGEETVYLKIGSKTYSRVRGSKPYYLRLKGTPLIVFVTENRSENATLHLLNTETKSEILVGIDDFNFGSYIGFEAYGKKLGDSFTDAVEQLDSDHLLITSYVIDAKEQVLINVKKRKIERTEAFVYSKDGSVKRHFIDEKEVFSEKNSH
jgi:hypothetical protein